MIRKEIKEVLREVESAISTLAYGEIIISVHHEKIVQIEKREKKRFSWKIQITTRINANQTQIYANIK